MKIRNLTITAIMTAIMVTATAQQQQQKQQELVVTLRNHVTLLASDSLSGRGFGFPEKQLAIDYITKQYEAAGFGTPYDGSYIHRFTHRTEIALIEGKNIIGIIEGSDPVLKHEYILLGAHYDHLGWNEVNGWRVVWNGADDNASGVALIIEAGRLLMENRESLGRSVIIAAFDGEEAGLLGSKAFVSAEIPSRFSIKAMFSFDMVGMLGRRGGIIQVGFASLKGSEETASEILARHTINVSRSADNISYRTDTWPFATKGIPAIHITTGTLSPYHKPEDDAPLLDYEGMARLVPMVADLTQELSDETDLIADNRFIRRKVDPTVMIGFRIGTGTSFHAHRSSFFNARPLFAAEAGPELQLKLSNSLRIQPAVMYRYAGSLTSEGKLRTHSVVPQIDFLLTNISGTKADPVAFTVAGAYWSYSFAGEEAYVPADFTGKYSNTDYGFRFGLCLKLMNVQSAIIWQYGLKRVNLNEDDGKLLNRGFSLTTTYFF